MGIVYSLDGDEVTPINLEDGQIVNSIPPAVYSLQFRQLGGFYLKRVKNRFSMPEKLYGDTPDRCDRVVNTYMNRVKQTGVLLTGSKGTGKTLLSEKICNTMIDTYKLPVIVINSSFSGDNFSGFLNSLGECVILFDEFGKVYNKKDSEGGKAQSHLLTLLDGVYSTKRLILMTENSTRLIDSYILDRPGRVFYHFEYDRVDSVTIDQYAEEHGVEESEIAEIREIAGRVDGFSFDMLGAIIAEMQLYGIGAKEAVKFLNINTKSWYSKTYKVLGVVNTETGEKLTPSQSVVQPDNDGDIYITAKSNKATDKDDDGSLDVTSNNKKGDCVMSGFVNTKHAVNRDDGEFVILNGIYAVKLREMPPIDRRYVFL